MTTENTTSIADKVKLGLALILWAQASGPTTGSPTPRWCCGCSPWWRASRRRGGGLAVRARKAVPHVRARVLDRSEEGGLAHAQGDDPDDRGGVRVRARDGGFLWISDKTLEWVLYDLLLGWKKT
jgi:hypothetical protein